MEIISSKGNRREKRSGLARLTLKSQDADEREYLAYVRDRLAQDLGVESINVFLTQARPSAKPTKR